MDEAQLIASMACNDSAAWREFDNHYRPLILDEIQAAYLVPYEDAQDLAQDVIIKAFKSIGHFRGDCSLWTWICKIIWSKYMDSETMKARRVDLIYHEGYENFAD